MIKRIIILSILLIPNISKAETHVYSNDIKQDWVWSKDSSPYILEEPIYIPDEYSLTIESGVEVLSATTTEDPNTITLDGDLKVLGTKDSPVRFTNLNSLYISNSDTYITNAIFESTGLDIHRSTSTIENVEIRNAFNGITAKGSNIKILNSTLLHNTYGISSYIFQPFFQASSQGGIGGLGNAVNDIDNILDPKQNVISIFNSRILESTNIGIINQTLNPIDARNNWWGSPDGPTPSETMGLVDTEPWLKKDPNDTSICCSNIVFIPGLQASRLYKDEKGVLGTTTNTLWEPNTSKDIDRLYMDQNGVSIDKGIYTKDIITTIPFVKKIYSSFSEKLDSLVKEGKISSWTAIPYDWRMDVRDVVNDSLINTIIESAHTSKTGKVSIVAHSNGGLVTKVIEKKLREIHKSDILDQIIFVAVPELGTPEALLSMLHGYDQSIALGTIMNQNTARKFSQNLPGVYGLLPNKKFFENNPITIISDRFKSNTNIMSFEGMKDFLLNNSFSKLVSSNINTPLTLNSKLIDRSTTLHSYTDNWVPASTTKTTAIFGWGLPTGQGIEYEKEPHCTNSCTVSFVPVLDIAGDGTVLTKSNSNNSNSSSFLNLKKLTKDRRININHANILESQDLIAKVTDIATNNISTTTKAYDKYFTETEPIDNDKYLTIKIYSPVDIDVYDSEGNHTGLVPNSPYGLSEEGIPGSFYGDFGSMKMVMVPYDPSNSILLNGNDTGTYIIKSEVTQSGEVLASTTFSELPVIPNTNIEFVIGNTVDSFATSTILNIDTDGDGSIDVIGRTDKYLKSTSTDPIKDISNYIESLRKIVVSLKLKKSVEEKYLKRLDNITRILEKGNVRKAEKILKKMVNKGFKKRGIKEIDTKEQTNRINSMIRDIEDRYMH